MFALLTIWVVGTGFILYSNWRRNRAARVSLAVQRGPEILASVVMAATIDTSIFVHVRIVIMVTQRPTVVLRAPTHIGHFGGHFTGLRITNFFTTVLFQVPSSQNHDTHGLNNSSGFSIVPNTPPNTPTPEA